MLAIPGSSVLDTGIRQAVLVDKGEGRYAPRQVKLGRRGGGYIEVRDGLAEGDAVVTSANFLIDAESWLGCQHERNPCRGTITKPEKRSPCRSIKTIPY